MKKKLIALLFFASNGALQCMDVNEKMEIDEQPAKWQPESLITKAILAGEIKLVESHQVNKLLGSASQAWLEERYRLLFTRKNGSTFRSDFMNIAAWDCNLDPKAKRKDTPETQECFEALELFGDAIYESGKTPNEYVPWLGERWLWGGMTFFREFKTHKNEILARLELRAQEEAARNAGEK